MYVHVIVGAANPSTESFPNGILQGLRFGGGVKNLN